MGAEKLPNGQQTTHVEDRGYGFRTGVQFPATPPKEEALNSILFQEWVRACLSIRGLLTQPSFFVWRSGGSYKRFAAELITLRLRAKHHLKRVLERFNGIFARNPLQLFWFQEKAVKRQSLWLAGALAPLATRRRRAEHRGKAWCVWKKLNPVFPHTALKKIFSAFFSVLGFLVCLACVGGYQKWVFPSLCLSSSEA